VAGQWNSTASVGDKKICHASERWHPVGMAYHFFWHLAAGILKAGKKPVLNALKLDASVRWHDKHFFNFYHPTK
jgi:hypothetical protein